MNTEHQETLLEQPIPRLKATLNLSKFENAHDGSPRWTLHDPILNEYYQLGWQEFECISRFHNASTIGELKKAINTETSLDIDEHDIQNLIKFLAENNLLSLSSCSPQQRHTHERSWFEKLLHGYLFFTIPLIKPQKFLNDTYPYIKPFLTKTFMYGMATLLLIGFYLTAGRLDEFTHTFMQLLTPGGIALSLIILSCIKILHEFGHAYTATKYGLPVPHMGIAFIIMYPIFYTETTASWRIAERYKRVLIGLSGIICELYIAAFFLLLWNITSDPGLQTICVTVVAISLIGSLLINLNPLMRFDGYYICSDLLGIENMQSRSFATARWQIRKWLFDTSEEHPEQFSTNSRKSLLLIIGLSTMIYRFFLFLGIALLVYYLFFKPLGLILMLLELWWFIGRPIYNELSIWWQNRATLMASKRAKMSLSVLGLCLILLLLPINTHVSAPAMLIPNQLQSLYSPEAAFIKELHVKNSQPVKAGDILAVLESDQTQHKYQKAKLELERLTSLQEKQSYLPDHLKPNSDIKAQLKAAKEALQNAQLQIDRLVMQAPFDGIITDLAPSIHQGRYVKPTDLLFRIKNQDEMHVVAFVNETELTRIEQGNTASFYSYISPFQQTSLEVSYIAPANTQHLQWPELSSIYGGEIATSSSAKTHRLQPLQSIYLIDLTLSSPYQDAHPMAIPGKVSISSTLQIPAFVFINQFISLLRREINLN